MEHDERIHANMRAMEMARRSPEPPPATCEDCEVELESGEDTLCPNCLAEREEPCGLCGLAPCDCDGIRDRYLDR
jgi:hypothetical protein